MPMNVLERSESVDLTYVSQQHEALRQAFFKDPIAVRENPACRDEFISKVDALLDQLQQCVPEARTTAAANAVNQIASEWQMIFTSELRIPRNVFDVLKINRTPEDCEPTLFSAPSATLRREVITERIRERAYLISRDWKVNWLKRLLYAFNAQPNLVHVAVLSPPLRTPDDDWREACTWLACEVLDARIDLALQLGVDGFEFLDNVWLEEVKRLKAYLDWENARPDGSLDDARAHYDFACREIHKRLLDPTIKAGAESFLPIADWVRDKVLDDDGHINTAKRPYAHALVKNKARRLWEYTKCEDEKANWFRAEQYVRNFYENLVPAVNQNYEAIEIVLGATVADARTQTNCEIVNALETALVTYFFKPELMKRFFQGHTNYL